MNNNFDSTVKFEGFESENMSISDTIKFVYQSLVEKGYNPINQLIGYILSGDSSYITSHNNARAVIKRFERDEILEEVITHYLNRK
ncbi:MULTISPECIES: IreB family regulatory phosphoprotein [Romboutsia]|uniref:UPF0297 protein FRIFI_2097 n=1 Tax=Romboutsia hominis TaxID=1507512 RepID=A0A2P2BTC8_9FIRM|nr:MULTISPECIES: IreB family regulatory phosphoprotein [Romboutsia]MCH1960892.1 IreB family regulatory phosphoprotein [Romboutsia hominis]MCH1968674.1 IreB family regulatory phosphoprotein [Romboutsia hominis]MDB8789671.1 IreB family regulatory phosphoprotein [Romboutsia sp. 1001216sp1]MDB8792989.1 IreB family regulatory phosphoprotein [Romboutsia sp. 1001216sp1]MDB8795208.1 IreB family regulatory phosphoprotein [Romboutsia sp. 1001216sp1]